MIAMPWPLLVAFSSWARYYAICNRPTERGPLARFVTRLPPEHSKEENVL
jgi:hypothetical protein